MNATEESTDPYPFEGFAPTLSQCFVLVIVGYLLSRLNILSPGDVKGVISLATYFAMPGIICVSLMDADFSDFRWELPVGIFLGKCITFVFIAGFWILLKGDLGVASVLALFCTQSNDLPVGNPLISSLYKNYRPQMMKYLFLIPAMTVCLFVPVSNLMLSVHRKTTPGHLGPRRRSHWWKYVHREDVVNEMRDIAKSPVLISTVCGLVLNFALEGGAPDVLRQPIQVAAATIPGVALLMLGFSFVRKERHLLSSAVVPSAVLFLLKMVITPILLHGLLRMMTEESASSNLLSDFALLYGIVSPATTIFLTGREFRRALAVMSVALIVTSLTCFPVSYVVARLTIAPSHKLSTYVPVLKEILFWTACISISCDVICGITIMWRNQWQPISWYILYLLFTQVVTCCGLIMWCVTERQAWSTYCELVFYYGGEIAGYLWTGILALVLVLQHKSWIMAKRGFFVMLCTAFSVSAIMTSVMCLLIPYNTVKSVYVVAGPKPNFEFLQLMTTSILLFVSLTVVTGCLVFHLKSNRKVEIELIGDYAYDNTVFHIENEAEIFQIQSSKEKVPWAEKVQETTPRESYEYREDIAKNRELIKSVEEREWTFQLRSLLILSGLTMLVRFIANLFKLVRSQALEVMVPMEFLQSTLFIGQGAFILLTFGIDVRTIIIRLRRWCRKVTHMRDTTTTLCKETNGKNGGETEASFCSQFYKFYYSRCFSDLGKVRRWKGTAYDDCFWGHQLVDWLVTEGLCQDDVDAEGQGQKLLERGLIRHVSQKYPFYDAPYLYQFVKRNSIKKNCKKF